MNCGGSKCRHCGPIARRGRSPRSAGTTPSIGSRLTELALERAAELGKSRVVLGSSEMGLNVYRRIGFRETRALAVYASAAFPTTLQGAQPV